MDRESSNKKEENEEGSAYFAVLHPSCSTLLLSVCRLLFPICSHYYHLNMLIICLPLPVSASVPFVVDQCDVMFCLLREGGGCSSSKRTPQESCATSGTLLSRSLALWRGRVICHETSAMVLQPRKYQNLTSSLLSSNKTHRQRPPCPVLHPSAAARHQVIGVVVAHSRQERTHFTHHPPSRIRTTRTHS